MKPRYLLVQVSVTVAVLVLANVGVQRLSTNTVPRLLLRKCEQADPATDLFLGNSTMAAGLQEATFSATRPGHRALNAALGSSNPVEHYLIFAKQARHRGATVYYGFLDTQLTDPTHGDWATLVGNRAMAYYVDLDLALHFYAPDDPTKALQLRLVSRVPVLVERYAMWAKVERLRRVFGGIGLPTKETNRFGRAEDFALLEPDNEGKFARRCGRAAADHMPLSAPVASLLRRAKEQGAPVYVIEMPMPTSHRTRFYSTPEWAMYQAHLMVLIGEAGGVYVPAAGWVEDDGFADSLHLNRTGAEVFSRRLAHLVAELK